MSELKKGFKKHMYRNESMLNAIHDDLNKKKFNPKKLLTVFSAFAVALLLFIGTNDVVNAPIAQPVYATISVDINPSLELTIDVDGYVLEVYSYNADAEGMDLESLVGLEVDEAVEKIIEMAEDMGFIVTDDEQTDYVVVATNVEGAGDEALELSEDLQAKLDDLEAVSIVYFVASDEEKAEADEKDETMGISILNGLIATEDGSEYSVKDFVLDTANLEALSDRAVAFSNQDLHMANLIAKFIEDMAEYGIELDDYTEDLNSVEDTVKLKTLIAKIRNETRVDEMKLEKEITTEERDVAKEEAAEQREADKLAAEEERAEAAAQREADKAAAAAERAAAKESEESESE